MRPADTGYDNGWRRSWFSAGIRGTGNRWRIGRVSLVGAGPGDPDLLTVKALRRLREADLVLYDALIPPALLEAVGPVRAVCVGGRAGRCRLTQRAINSLMTRAATRGLRVVRLKCGDPFVLGRGGEEALALAGAGVPVEIVPGISTAVAAPALAGIPLTHRTLASGFVVVSGHSEPTLHESLGSIAPGSLTVVVLMGLATRATLVKLLIDRGWPADTPSALLLGVSSPESFTWIGPLEELPLISTGSAHPLCGASPEFGTRSAAQRRRATGAPGGSAGAQPPGTRQIPGTIVIGAVVELAMESNSAIARPDAWRDQRQLAGLLASTGEISVEPGQIEARS